MTFATIPDAFRAAVAAHPDRLALRDGDRSVTYAAFDAASNGVARALLDLGDERPVVLVAPLDLPTIEILHGAVKARRLAVPVDPRWPPDQWLAVVRETQGRLVVPDEATRAALPAAVACDALVADELRGDGDDPHLAHDPDAPAFVFFTSGSTGAPKGTVLGHGLVQSAIDLMRMEPDDRLALVAPLSFVTGALAALAVVLTGASGHLCDVMTSDPARIAAWLADDDITLMGLSPTILGLIGRAALDAHRPIKSLRLVVHGGEAGTAEHFALAHRAFPNARLVNAYGMTETGGAACEQEIDPDHVEEGEAMPVGRPYPDVHIDLVDEGGEPVDDGATGEIRVAAPRVALGYWNQPALTAERFGVRADGLRTVRTGDQGRFRADGTLEVLGRADRRVKVHGQLVDLAEVEQEIERLPDVRGAVVSSVPAADGSARVVAHVMLDRDRRMTVGELRRGLAGRLPPYAIPRAFFRVDEIPTAITGKIDRAWLRESAVGALPLETEYVAARNDRERAVAALFAEVLAVERVGVHDDFFELGGDSLSVVDLQAGLAEELALELTLAEVVDAATVAGIAARAGEPPTHHASPLVRVNDGHGTPLLCVTGAASSPLQLRPLARRLPDIDVRAFSYHGMEHRALPDRSVAAIARRNVRALRREMPRGPIRLLGYSFGGAVALEMANQLVGDGQPVELLVLVEPPLGVAQSTALTRGSAKVQRVVAQHAASRPDAPALAQWFARGRRLSIEGRDYAKARVRLASAGLIVRHGMEQHDVFYARQLRMLRKHRHRRYLGRVVLIGSRKYLDRVASVVDDLLPRVDDGGHRTDVELAAFHTDLLREPAVAALAHVLDGLIVPDPSGQPPVGAAGSTR